MLKFDLKNLVFASNILFFPLLVNVLRLISSTQRKRFEGTKQYVGYANPTL
jgi:hypothetical protein